MRNPLQPAARSQTYLPYVHIEVDDHIYRYFPLLPCWYPPVGTSPAEIAKFDNLMWHMARHELRHVEIIEQHARILEQRLKNSNTCNDDIWDEIADQVWEDEDAAQEAFHASPAGQTIPYP